MTAATVIARPATGKRAAVRSAAPARTPVQIAFEGAADGLECAANVELRHAQSGDSDILLRIAAETARRAAESGSTDAVGPVYEISALIKAARLVPGDVEDTARRSAIAAAATDLASLVDCTALSIVDPGADRPAARPQAQAEPAMSAERENSRRTFERISAVLAEASNLDELPHASSGESDRLLRIASDLAFDAAETPPSVPECIAFDIAALVKASRLVPGDVENARRRSLIEAAAVDLASLADCSGPASMMDPEADRPALRIRGRAKVPGDDRASHLDAENALSDNFHWLGGLLATIMCLHDGDIADARLPSPAHRRALVRHAFAVATRAHAIAMKVGTFRNRADVLEELAFACAALAALHSSFEDGQGNDTFFGDDMVCGLVGAAGNCLERARLWLNPPTELPSPVTDPFFLEDRRPVQEARPASREVT